MLWSRLLLIKVLLALDQVFMAGLLPSNSLQKFMQQSSRLSLQN